MRYFAILVVAAAANIIYQSMQRNPRYEVAFERTWFQALVLWLAWLTDPSGWIHP